MKRLAALVLGLFLVASVVGADPFGEKYWQSFSEEEQSIFIMGAGLTLNWIYENDLLFSKLSEADKKAAKSNLYHLILVYKNPDMLISAMNRYASSGRYPDFDDLLTMAIWATTKEMKNP